MPEIGGNLISLKKGDAEMLHQYDTLASIAQKPTWYGLPVLFPPNRIAVSYTHLDVYKRQGHCTGVAAYRRLRLTFGDRLHSLAPGLDFEV